MCCWAHNMVVSCDNYTCHPIKIHLLEATCRLRMLIMRISKVKHWYVWTSPRPVAYHGKISPSNIIHKSWHDIEFLKTNNPSICGLILFIVIKIQNSKNNVLTTLLPLTPVRVFCWCQKRSYKTHNLKIVGTNKNKTNYWNKHKDKLEIMN